MDIKVSKADLFWSYVAQFFILGSGFITLPLILHKLSTEEIAMNYLMMTIGAMVAMVDFGFSPQFGRNFTYVFSGAQKLAKEGLSNDVRTEVNYHLLKCLLDAAKLVYKLMSILVLLLMMTFGTWYIYYITEGFTNVENSLLIWALYCISVFFNVYSSYYSALLTGRGQIKEQKKTLVVSRVVYIVLAYIQLLAGVGLLGVCVANIVSPFVCMWMSHRYFYDEVIKEPLSQEVSSKKEVLELFPIIWYNAKKIGITSVGAYAALKFSLFISGIYLTMQEVSSFGLLMQLANIIVVVSITFNATLLPQLTFCKVNNDTNGLIRKFSLTLNVYYVIFITLSAFLVFLGPWALRIIGSNAVLPSTLIVALYLLVLFLENNHSLFAAFITIGNSVPYTKVAITSGALVCIGDLLILNYTNLGLLGMVTVQGAVQLAYNNWYWPLWVCRETKTSLFRFVIIGFRESYTIVSQYARQYLL